MSKGRWTNAKEMRWILFLGFLLSFSAHAQDWYKVASSEQGDSYFIDLKSIIRVGSIVSYWSKGNYGEPTRYGDMSSLGSNRVNCSTIESIIGLTYFYSESDNNGERTSMIFPKNQNWQPIVPGTINASLFRFVCKR
jgi:hypothetical protein